MATFSTSTASAWYKNLYGKKSENTFNNATPLLSRLKRDTGFVGKQMNIPVPMGFTGGVGSGSLPTADVATYGDAVLTRKKLYAVILLDREGIKASANDKGAFGKITEHQTQKGVESFTRNFSRTLFAAENGMLGQGDGATNVTGAGTTGDPYDVIISASSWNEGFWEENDLVNVGSETTTLEVQKVIPSTRALELVGTSATLAGAVGGTTTAKIYMQGSKDNDPQSIREVLRASSSTMYSVTVGRRWQSYQKDASSAAISVDLMNEVVLGVHKQCGKVPNLIVTSFKQYRKLLNQQEDFKSFTIEPRDKSVGAAMKEAGLSFGGLVYNSSAGPIPIVADRMAWDNEMYFLNDNYITVHSAGPPEWVDEDGSVLLRSASADSFEARYAWYGQTYCPPPFHGILYGLA